MKTSENCEPKLRNIHDRSKKYYKGDTSFRSIFDALLLQLKIHVYAFKHKNSR